MTPDEVEEAAHLLTQLDETQRLLRAFDYAIIFQDYSFEQENKNEYLKNKLGVGVFKEMQRAAKNAACEYLRREIAAIKVRLTELGIELEDENDG